MNIVHVNLAMGYTEGLNYQENCVSKCHALAGHKVTVITTPYCFNKGEWGPCQTAFDYINEYGVHVMRLPFLYKLPYKINKQIGRFKGTYQVIKQINPDVICIHNIQFQDLRIFAKYKRKYPNVKIYVDNHADFSNSARTWISRNILYRFWWKPCAKAIEPYTDKFFGVMPSRVDFLSDVYRISKEKCELLVMGAEDEVVEKARQSTVKVAVRKQFNIDTNDFLIVTGGKIDAFKTQTLSLMQAVKQIPDKKVKLLVFGSIEEQLRDKVAKLCDGKKVQYIGWAKGNQSYEYFAAADLVVFPGRHSVYWEQVAGLGIPMICKYWDGTTHVDLGGNVVFLYQDSEECIRKAIEAIISDNNKYSKMKEIAVERGMATFSYNEISKRAIGL